MIGAWSLFSLDGFHQPVLAMRQFPVLPIDKTYPYIVVPPTGHEPLRVFRLYLLSRIWFHSTINEKVIMRQNSYISIGRLSNHLKIRWLGGRSICGYTVRITRCWAVKWKGKRFMT